MTAVVVARRSVGVARDVLLRDFNVGGVFAVLAVVGLLKRVGAESYIGALYDCQFSLALCE
jgi:hypothetical protein